MKHWLLKSEPDSFSYDDLTSAPEMRTLWDGIRNFQARNTLRDDMAQGDEIFFYHSSCKVPAIVGVCRITRTGIVDPSAFDPLSDYYDIKSDPETPRWITIEVEALHKLNPPVTLKQMRGEKALQNMVLLNNPRLSVQPVSDAEWRHIISLSAAQN